MFELFFNSSYDNIPGSTSITQMSENSDQLIPINSQSNSEGSAFISGSESYEQVGPGVNPTSGEDDQEITFGPGIVQNDGTVVDLTIEGNQPTSGGVSPNSNFNLYSWDDIGSDPNAPSADDFIVTEVIDFQSNIDSLGSGGEFEFDSNQTSFSGLITKLIEEDNIGSVFVVGTGGTKSSIGSVTTNFTSNTKLEAKDSGAARNGIDNLPYTQLEYFYNSDVILASNGWSINQGTITFDGSATGFVGPFSLKFPIL